MGDPYEILGVARDASEADIRHRYLELVRQFPPDRAAERFTEIHQAYERLRDPVMRMESTLFEPESGGTIAQIIAELRRRLRQTHIPTQTLLSLAERG
ncbi:MAG: J domain-containing protein [Pirellulales bacterium]